MLKNCNCPNNTEILDISSNQSEIDSQDQCFCGFSSTQIFPQNCIFGHSYVPNQILSNIYVIEIALKRGTIFPELVSPYFSNQSLEEINYLKTSKEFLGGKCNVE